MIGGVYDGLNLLSKATPARIANAWKIYSDYRTAIRTGNPIMTGMPISISVEPTTSCNLRCPECPSGLRSFTRPTGKLDTSLLEKILQELGPTLGYLILYFQGEPYLHPEFLSMVKVAREHRIYTATSTNAHYLNAQSAEATVRSGLDRLIISIDGTTQESYQQYRIGGNLEKVLEGTRHIIEWKKKLRSRTPQTIFQFLVVRHNEHEVPSVYALAKKMGVDKVVLKTAQINDYKNGSPLIPVNEKYSRYRQHSDGTYHLKNEMLDECWKMWHSCVITWDGKVVPCCFDKDAHHVLGNVADLSFREIWFSKEYDAFRKMLFQSRSGIDICTNCTEGTRVWAS